MRTEKIDISDMILVNEVSASDLGVEYEREGVPRELRYAIADDEATPTPAKR